jgi:hypothetical protein
MPATDRVLFASVGVGHCCFCIVRPRRPPCGSRVMGAADALLAIVVLAESGSTGGHGGGTPPG